MLFLHHFAYIINCSGLGCPRSGINFTQNSCLCDLSLCWLAVLVLIHISLKGVVLQIQEGNPIKSCSEHVRCIFSQLFFFKITKLIHLHFVIRRGSVITGLKLRIERRFWSAYLYQVDVLLI